MIIDFVCTVGLYATICTEYFDINICDILLIKFIALLVEMLLEKVILEYFFLSTNFAPMFVDVYSGRPQQTMYPFLMNRISIDHVTVRSTVTATRPFFYGFLIFARILT